ncbi:MAG: bifunctional phosphoribosylaminoimidazolecarboxamide formyltransferase/IMP cyclohydrolase [Halobacteriovoraceae bacterium]|nr:bifunctional phosphoribosylaminoimidazolecarboxamide formyltransferase/IMP cyclohydrolase [Halobacteriovoraceae bacterium]
MKKTKIHRALISVSDKSNLKEIVEHLNKSNVEIIASGGTGKFISELGIKYTPIQEITGNPESFGGRMKTLSFQVASALLFRRNNPNDIEEAKSLNILPIDLVICNLYPFSQVAKNEAEIDCLVENIDIGGPNMIRAAAKNYESVAVLTDPKQYFKFIENTKVNLETTFEYRIELSLAAFEHTAKYDAVIYNTLCKRFNQESSLISIDLNESKKLRYGENPHQDGYVVSGPVQGLANNIPLQGKELSFNNLVDSDAALKACLDFNTLAMNTSSQYKYATIIVKHANPCGQALMSSPLESLKMAWNSDPISAFGGVICVNGEFDAEMANFVNQYFVEIIIAQKFSDSAKELLSQKKNLRLLEYDFELSKNDQTLNVKSIDGGYVLQNQDIFSQEEFKIITKTEKDYNREFLNFSVLSCKSLKSNAISITAKNENGFFLQGAGMGNPNRLISLKQAVDKATDNNYMDLKESILVSDAFFPFDDNIELANSFGIKTIIQPGGSIKDNEVIACCDKYEICMYFTGTRHFNH